MNKLNAKKFLLQLKVKLNLQTPEDWNSLTTTQIQKYGGGSFLKIFSIFELKCIGNPNGIKYYDKPWKPSGYWEKRNNVEKFLCEFKGKLNLKTIDDWNNITTKDIRDFGGNVLLKKYSLLELKCTGCPEGSLIFKESENKQLKYWENKENVKLFLNNLQNKLNLKNIDDWNSLTQKQIINNGGSSLLKIYSMYDLRSIGFPDGKFVQTNPPGYWDNLDNIHDFLDQFKRNLNVNTMEDWNSVTQKQIKDHGGSGLLEKYSMFEIKCFGCPDGKSLFLNNPNQKPIGYWDDIKNVQLFVKHLESTFNLRTLEDWDSLTKQKIRDNGGATLLNSYSVFDLKCIGCPEGKSYFSLPNKIAGYWDENENIKNFIEELKNTFNLKNPSDWNRVSKSQIQSLGGGGFLSKYLTNQEDRKQIELKFPEISYIRNLEPRKGRSSQRWLFLQVQKLFPGEEIVEDYFHSDLSRKTGSSFQFDVFVIGRNIAFEYHGKQHYEELPSGFAPLEMYKNRDHEKEKICSENGIQLIIIPYWWNNKLESLKQTVDDKLREKTL